MDVSNANCVACGHSIDAVARVCPYCGANPTTGEKVDTEAVMREVFRPKRVPGSSGVLDFARQRQGVVVASVAIVLLLVLFALHQFVTMRNKTAVTTGPAVPLTELTDISDQRRDAQPLPMPPLQFRFDGNGQTMRTFIVESGAVTPPEVAAAQQAAAQQAAAQKTATPPVAKPGVAVPAKPAVAVPARPPVAAPARLPQHP